MKTVIKTCSLILVIFSVLLLCTCSSGSDTSTISISLGMLPGKTAVSIDQLVHIITLSGPSGTQTMTITGSGTAKATVVAGTWSIRVEAYLEEELYAVGSATVEVKAGKNTDVLIQMTVIQTEPEGKSGIGGGGGGGNNGGGTTTVTAPAITTSSLPDGAVGIAYSQPLIATGTTPITWSIDSGSLPGGLSLGTATGVISGTPTAAATFSFTIKAENTAGSDTKTLSIVITPAPVAPTIITSYLPGGEVGVAYSQTLTVTGTAPITWSVDSGLRYGLSLNAATGEISGIPTNVGTLTFTVTAVNAAGSDTMTLSMIIIDYYTVTFVHNDGSGTVTPISGVVSGSTVTPPTSPTSRSQFMTGLYTGTGPTTPSSYMPDDWYDSLGTVFTSSTPVDGDMTVKFQWTEPTLVTAVDATDIDAVVSQVKTGAASLEIYTWILEEDLEVAGTTRALNVTSANLTIKGVGTGRKIKLNSAGSLITVGGSGTASPGSTLTLENITLQGYNANNAPVVNVGLNGHFTMLSGSIITGNTTTSGSAGGVYVSGNGSSFTLDGGAITGNHYTGTGTPGGSGGVYFLTSTGSTFTMISGSIENNTAPNCYGGGVLVVAGTSSSGTFEMQGGTISNNSAKSGGGVALYLDGSNYTISLNMTNSAEISSNHSTGTSASPNDGGGGVYAFGNSGGPGTISIVMDDSAVIKDNDAARDGGGGVYLYRNPSYTHTMSLTLVTPMPQTNIDNNTAPIGTGTPNVTRSPTTLTVNVLGTNMLGALW